MTITIGTPQELNVVDVSTANVPITATSGNLLLVFVSNYNGASQNLAIPAGWTRLALSSGTGVRPSVFAKISDGTEGATVAIQTTSAANFDCAAKSFSLGNWSGNLADISVATIVEQSASATISSIDPAQITASWGAEANNLFFVAGFSARGNNPFTVTPSGYTSTSGFSGLDGSGYSAHISVGYKVANAASDDPSVYTSATYQHMVAVGIVVKGAEVNEAPTLDTPQPDTTIQEGQTGTIDLGANTSDPNTGDTATYSITPDISLVAGFSFSTTTGVITYDGTQEAATAVSYTYRRTDSGSLFVEDTFNLTVIPPALSIGTITDTTPVINTQITVDHSNALAALTTPNFNIASQTSTQAVIDIPDITTFILVGQTFPTINFNTPVAIPLSDGTNSADVNLLGIENPAGTYFGEITSIAPEGVYANDTGVATGMYGYFFNVVGNLLIDPATGLIMADAAGGSCEYKLYNGEWGSSTTVTIAGQAMTVVSASLSQAISGTEITLALANASETGKTLANPAGFLPIISESATSLVFLMPEPKTFGTRTLTYNEAITFSVTDGADIDSVQLTILPEAGYDFATLSAVGPLYTGNASAEVGDQAYGVYSQGFGTANLATGVVTNTTEAEYEYWLRDVTDGTWGLTSTLQTFSDPTRSSVVVSSPVTTTGSVLEGYTSVTAVDGDSIFYDGTTLPDGVGVTVDATGVWSLDAYSPEDQTFTVYVKKLDGTVGDVAAINYTAPAFAIGTLPTSTPVALTTDVVPVNGSGPYTATLKGQVLPIQAQTQGGITILWPELSEYGDLSANYGVSYDLVVTDSSDAATDTVQVSLQKPSTMQFAQIASIDAQGVYAGLAGVQVGHYGLIKATTGDITVDPTTGAYTNDVDSTVDVATFSTIWSATTQLNFAGVALPTIVSQPSNGSVVFSDGSSVATFSVAATDTTGSLTYQWEFSDNAGSTFTNVAGATSFSLVVNGSAFSDTGNSGRLYRCKVSNVGGTTTSSTATLTITAPPIPVITVQPSNGVIQAGNASSQHTFAVTATGATSYQWQYSDDTGSTFSLAGGATGPAHIVVGSSFPTNVLSGRLYRCLVTNASGSVLSSTASLTITPSAALAPTLSNGLVTATGSTTATGSVETTENNGTLYWLFSTQAVVTANTILSTGASRLVTQTGAQVVQATGLALSTQYYLHFLHIDADGNYSNLHTTQAFTTYGPTPVINDIDIDNDVYPGQVAVIHGSNFGSAMGTVTLGGQAQIVNTWTNTAITITIVKGLLDYGTGLTLVVALP